MATRIGPSTRPSIPNRCTPPRTLMKITRPLNSVRPPSNTGRRRLSAMVEIPAQMARSTIARHQCPVNPSQSEAGTKIRSEEHTSELQSLRHLVCRLLLEKKKYLNLAQTSCVLSKTSRNYKRQKHQ